MDFVTIAYVVSGLLELGGLFLVVRDVRDQRRRVDRVQDVYTNLPYTGARIGGRETSPHVLLNEIKNLQAVDKAVAEALAGDSDGWWRWPYLGPLLLGLGIALGTAANLAA